MELLLSYETCATVCQLSSSHFPCQGGWHKNGGGVIQGPLNSQSVAGPDSTSGIMSEDVIDIHMLALAVLLLQWWPRSTLGECGAITTLSGRNQGLAPSCSEVSTE